MANQIISIKKVLHTVVGEHKAAKYLQKADSNFTDSGTIYQAALTHLLSGKTEKAIIHIIYGLDIDRQNVQLLHLCKTMLLSISEYLYENNSEFYRQKFPDLPKAETELKKKLKEKEKFAEESNFKLRKLEKTLFVLKPNLISYLGLLISYSFKKKTLVSQISALEVNLSNANDEMSELKKYLKYVVPLVKVDEFSKILGLIIEVCTFPTRYEWVLQKK
jgi:hypothetical protein